MATDVRIVGTSHISESSAREITKAFNEFQPDVIAVELDRRRLVSLQDQAMGGSRATPPLSMIRQVGLVGYLFVLIGGWLQKRLAGIVKVQPGVDMLEAVKLAGLNKKQLALVDQDILITLRHLSKAFDWRHKFRMLWDVISGPFQKQKIKFDLRKVPSKKVIKQLMQLMKERYPAIHKVFIVERNIVMAAKLDRIARAHPEKKILLIIGAGHEEDLRIRLKSSSVFSVI